MHYNVIPILGVIAPDTHAAAPKKADISALGPTWYSVTKRSVWDEVRYGAAALLLG